MTRVIRICIVGQSCAMLAVVFVLCLVGGCSAETNAYYDLKCSEHENVSATMHPSDEFAGRYTTQVCVEMKPNVSKWELNLLYKERARSCYKSKYSVHPRDSHSTFVAKSIDGDLKDLNCTHVCLTTQFDFIFNSCYVLKSVLHTNTSEYAPFDSYFNITNPYTLDDFDVTTKVSIFTHEKDTTIKFFFPVRPNQYSVELNYLNKSLPLVDVNNNCTITDSISLECIVWVEAGCYKIWLRIQAPWAGKFPRQALVTSEWCVKETPGVAGVVDAGWAEWAAVWASLAVALLLALVALLWRHRDHRHLHKRVLQYWTRHSTRAAPAACGASDADGASEGEGEGVVRVLLLYARECERGQRLVAALRDLLQQHAHVQVQDLFSAESMRVGGGAPHAWVQRALHTQRVLVLQTPALAALYTPRHTHHNLSAPLLGAGAMYRTPHYGDTLLQYALRLLADDACHPGAYRKYYLATLSALPTELFPGVVPFTRYELPDAAALLARDVTTAPTTTTNTPTDNTPALLHLQQAAEEFVSYVHHNPDYLMDELLIT